MRLEYLKNKSPIPNFAKRRRATASPQERLIQPRPSRAFRHFSEKKQSNLEILRQNWYGARILILGFGKEGMDTLLFLRKLFPKKTLGIADIKHDIQHTTYNIRNIRWHLGKNYLKSLKKYDIIIKSPGVPIHLPEVERAFNKGEITSQTEIFFSVFAPCKRSYDGPAVASGVGGENCPAPLDSKNLTGQGKIVGVTGTKGKGTTASLIYEILRAGGIKTHLVGNIEKPVLNLLFSATPKDVFVFELSSHQLYKLRKSPQIAVFLNLYPAHLEFFKNFQEYVSAKANIARYQKKTDYLIYNSKDKMVREIARKSKAKKVPINLGRVKNLKIPLIGKFNLLNVAAAIEVGKLFKIPKEKIIKGIKNFKPLPHRLEFVGAFRGIKFYNDSLATIPESSIAAIESFGNKVGTIILGGSESNVEIGNLAKKILKSKINNLIFFPTTGEKIWKEILRQTRGRGLPKHLVVSRIEPFFASSMREAVDLAYKYTKKGKICLLSPAYPSFSLFKDYKERGNLFKKFVKKLSYVKRK